MAENSPGLPQRTRDRVPLQWAVTESSLAALELAFFDKTSVPAHLDQALEYAEAAREVFVAAGVDQYIAMIDANIRKITARW